MSKITDDKRIKTIKKILKKLHAYKRNVSLQDMLNMHRGNHNDKLFAITGEEIYENQSPYSCGHWAKAFAYENSLLPKDEQLDIKTMVSTHPDHLIDAMSNHTLPCIKMDDGNYYAIDPQVRDVDLPMIKTPIKVGGTIKHIIKGLKNEPEYKIMALIDWTDERLYSFNKFTKMASDRSEKTKEMIAEIEAILKSTTSSKRQEYIFCEEALKHIPDIAKKMKVAVIEYKDTVNHIKQPLHRIVLELETKDGQKQQCYFAPRGNYATFTIIDDNHKILWQKSLNNYIKLYNDVEATEKRLLKNSTVEDLNIKKPETKTPNDKILSKEQIKKDVSVLARMLIRAYVGWPKHNEETKIAVLDTLLQIYNTQGKMTVKEFRDKIKQIPNLIPDNHLTIIDIRNRYNEDFVGKNMTTKTDSAVLLKKENNIAFVGIKTLSDKRLSPTEKAMLDNLTNWADKNLPDSSALIVDLRGNSGGNSGPTDRFAKYLCGGVYNSPAEKEYIRATKEAIKTTKKTKLFASLPKQEDKLVCVSVGQTPGVNKAKAYMKPIYILIDKKTGSSAERFVLAMRHHPMVKFVGDNSAGMEVFGNMSATIYLHNSGANVAVGMHYRELSKDIGGDDYELHGLTPDIKCKEGEDALEIALKDFDEYRKQCAGKFKKATDVLKTKQMVDVPKNLLKKQEKTL